MPILPFFWMRSGFISLINDLCSETIYSRLERVFRQLPKTKSYSLYLVKPDIESFEDVFTDTAKEMIQAGDAVLIDSDNLGDEATVVALQISVEIDPFNHTPI